MSNQNNEDSGVSNIANLNNAMQETVIHIDLNKTFYSITPLELDNIEAGSSSLWKDITLTSLGIGIPCSVNALIEYQKETKLDGEIFLNCLFGALAITMAIIFGIMWYKSSDKCKTLIDEIKQRTQYKMS